MKKWVMLGATLVAAAMAGCSAGVSDSGKSGGGGAGGGGTCTSNCGTPAMTASLSSTTVTTASPATVTVHVQDANAAAVAGAVVNFTVNPAVGKLSAAAALTDGSGNAHVTLSPASASTPSGADTLQATSTVAGSAVQASIGYSVNASGAQFASLSAPDVSASAPMPAYSQTSLQLSMTGVSTSQPVTVSVTSDCVGAGKATISPASTVSTTGSISFVYQDTGGCGSSRSTDNITVTASGANPPTDTLSLPLQAPAPSSIAFVSATNNPIFLAGSGGTSSSLVTFKVVDIAGNPLPSQHVTLNLTTFTGGLQLDGGAVPITKSSNTLGQVSVIITAGSVPTPVRVLAVLGDNLNGSTTAVSSQLAVGTGLPTQTGFSLAQHAANIEGYDWDDSWNSYTVSATDRTGNPVPQGTSISFRVEQAQGIIPTQVTTPSIDNGGLSVVTVNFGSKTPTHPMDGHVTILAYAAGEESFTDQNGNNMWDPGEPFQDLGDPFIDNLFTGVFDASVGDEWFSTAGTAHGGSQACNNVSNVKDPLYRDPLLVPSMAGTCDGTWTGNGKVYVRRAIETVMSTSDANPHWLGTSFDPANAKDPYGLAAQLPAACSFDALQTGASASSTIGLPSISGNPTIYVGQNSTASSVYVLLSDANPIRLNPMPAETTVNIDGVNDDGTYPSTLTPIPRGLTFNPAAHSVTTHTIKLTTAGPIAQDGKTHGTQTISSFTVKIVADNPPSTCTAPPLP